MPVEMLKVIATKTSVNTEFLLSKIEDCEPKSGALWVGPTGYSWGKVPSGSLLGRNSTTKLFAPLARALITATTSSANTATIGTTAAKRFKVGMTGVHARRGDTDASLTSTGRAITGITNGVVTLDGGTFSIDHTRGDYLAASDGTEVPYGISFGDANTATGRVDQDGAAVHRDGSPIMVLRRGVVVESKLSNCHDSGSTTIYSVSKTLLQALGFRFE